MIQCPNCGYKQESGDKCQKCSSLFSYYSQSQIAGTSPSRAFETASSGQKEGLNSAPRSKVDSNADGFFISWRTAYRIASSASLVLLILVLILIFHKPATPTVPISATAAASAEAKFSQAQAAAKTNQPYQLSLDRAEVNSYLNSNLQLPGNTENSAPAASSAPAGSATVAEPAANGGAGDPQSALPANASIADVQSAVKDVNVDLDGDLVKAYVTFNFHGKDLSLELDGHLSSANGYMQFKPVAGSLGSLPLPQSTLDAAVNRLMSSPENREKLRLPPGVSGIKVENGHVVMDYQ